MTPSSFPPFQNRPQWWGLEAWNLGGGVQDFYSSVKGASVSDGKAGASNFSLVGWEIELRERKLPRAQNQLFVCP